ncbi:MAG TPA: CinA family nicotinamide mononucleotide deamidase-related protein, partial [Thermoanaerobaculia bacterium]|nr:CinA family nicotinamide mononucleotide deamidase-related protein [Thermoanaerobaculia bacterium]
ADDLTREGVAEFAGRPLETDREILEEIRGRFARRGIAMPAINEKQALVVEGSRPLRNPRGSAPGIWLETRGAIVACLPGVPSEMRHMFEDQVFPELARRFGAAGRRRRILKIAAMGESAVEEKVTPVYAKWGGHAFTILASVGEVQLHLAAQGTEEETIRILDAQEADFQEALGGRIYGRDDETLESVVGDRLRTMGATVATAESCTGGLIAQRITSVAGSSDYFLGAVVAYANAAKSEALGVRPSTLEAHGAVSEETAREMAEGARARFGASFALSATGVAGPGGGTPEKPVGTVWIALAGTADGTRARKLRPPGDRATIRGWTAAAALEMLREAIADGETA